jgi:putative ABC transport system substrate-binding protein
MDRRHFLLTSLTIVLSAPLGAEAQQAGKVAKVGHLSPGSAGPGMPRLPVIAALYQALGDLGWVEGQNLTVEHLGAAGKAERLPDLAQELVRRKVDVIVVGSCGGPLDAARQATTKIPIVVTTCNDDMVATGIVASLARPGGNITGLSKLTPELSAKRLALLKETLPTVSRVGVLWDPEYSDFAADWRALREAALPLGIMLHPIEVRRATDFEAALARLRHEGVEALITFSDLIVYLHTAELAEKIRRSRLPAIYAFREVVDAGGLMSYGPNIEHMYRRSAVYVDKILKGAKPAELPIEQPTKFELVINLKTAKALGLTIPPSLLVRADQVIE